MNKPVAWRVQNPQMFNDWITFPTQEQADLYAFHNGKGNLPEPLYTHPVINNGGNLEELNTKVQDASTSLESTPPINAEPVAWISEYTLKNCLESNLTDEVRATTTVTTNCTIPLYTHPVKELTDEEIWAIASEIEPVEIQWGVRLSNELNVLDFAKAILRKAQEK